jgi:hypothetical protein
MNLNKAILKLSLLALLIILFACNGTTDAEWSIENQSSATIDFSYKKHLYPYDINGSLKQGEKRIIQISSEDKASQDPLVPYDVFSDMKITNEQGEPMKKDWVDNNNWEIYIEETQTSPSKQLQTYKLVVKDQDF